MGHKPGAVFGILRGVRCFAGLNLYLDERRSVHIPWADVRALAEGRLPSDESELYELPVARLVLPVGVKLAFGSVRLGSEEHKLLFVPQAGHFAELPLQRRGDGCGHHIRAGAGQKGLNLNGGIIDFRQRGERQVEKARDAHQHDRDHQQRCGNRAVDEWR